MKGRRELSKMVKNHLKRLNVPKSWPVKRKTSKWIVKPRSSHPLGQCLPVSVILKEVLGFAATAKEAKVILNQKLMLVNKKARKEPKFGAGLLDVVELPGMKLHYRILLSKQGKLVLHPIDEKEASIRPCKIQSKRIVAGGKIQIAFADGTTMFTDNKEYKAGDTLVLSMPDNKVREHLKFEKGAMLYITAGRQASLYGTFEEVRQFSGAQPDNIVVSHAGKHYETRKDYAMVIGREKPAISMGD